MTQEDNTGKRIIKILEDYADKNLYPMHMPGHKRKSQRNNALPYRIDVTEVPGLDDLHRASGMLKEAMERTAALYGAERSFFLVNGSTCGILAAVGAVSRHGGEIIAARNCHISVFHAIQVMDLKVSFIMPGYNDKYEILTGIDPDLVERSVKDHPLATAVIITSPTYEGVISDIKSIARICHKYGKALIVDEAHGAHIGLFRKTPEEHTDDKGFDRYIKDLNLSGAVNSGADIVIQSPHKTLPSLTQTALLHTGRDGMISAERVAEELSIYETSSPSYILLSSLDECTDIINKDGDRLFNEYYEGLREFYAAASDLKVLDIPGIKEDDHGIFMRDPGKILISGKRAGIRGERIADILREEYKIETEMSCGTYALAMTTLCDEKEDLRKLSEAIAGIDAASDLYKDIKGDETSAIYAGFMVAGQEDPQETISITAAKECRSEKMSFAKACGKRSGEYVYIYPPGIPLIVPGELITRDKVSVLSELESSGVNIHRSASGNSTGMVAVALM